MPKLYWITNLRVFATIMVIFIHTSGGLLFNFHKVPINHWWVGNIVNGFGRFTVPAFVMISGALLLGRDIEVFSFLKKRFIRVWVPFTVWAIIYVLYHNIFEHHPISFKNAFLQYLTGGGGQYGHLWFVYMILGLYLVTPILNIWLSKATEAEVYFYLLLSFIATTTYSLIKVFYNLSIQFDLTYFSSYFGYFVAGYALKNKTFSFSKYWYLIAFMIGYAVTIFGTYFLSNNAGKYIRHLNDYFSPNSVLMTASIFMFFKEFLNQEILPKVMPIIDKASFGMYLSHLLIINTLSRKFGINWAWHNPIIGIFTHAGLTIIISFGLIFLLSKIPKSEWITG